MKKLLLLLTLTCLTFAIQAQPGSLLSAKKVGADNSFQFFDTLNNHFLFGRSLCNLGDIDGDGITDIAVGVNDQNISSGVVYILFLNSNGEVKNFKRITKNQGGLNTTSPNAFTEFGQSITNLGDVDGDGVIDIAVGNKGSSYGGEIYILFLNTDGTVKNHSRIASNVGGFNVSLTSNQIFSYSIANIGDVNGDGVIDIAVGDTRDSDGGTEKGAIYILFLNTNGTVKKHQKISQISGGFSDTLGATSRFGSSVCKFNKNKIVVGARNDWDGTDNGGAIWIMDIDSNGIVNSQTKITEETMGFNDTLSSGYIFGASVSNIGDLDGVSIPEIAVGTPGYSDLGSGTGAIFIFFLDTDDKIKMVKKFSNSSGDLPFTFDEFALFGTSIIPIGDFNGDKKLDILVSSSREFAPSQINKGRLNLLFLDGIEHDLSTSKFSVPTFEVQVFPNPASSHLQFSFGNNVSNNASVLLYDTHGRLLLSQQLQTHSNPSIDISTITTAGVYYVQIHCGGAVQYKKIVIE